MNGGRLVALALLSALAGAVLLWGGQRIVGVDPAGAAGARGYVLAHPAMIGEMIDTLRRREAARVIAANRDAILQPYAGAWAGNPKGDLTIVEYFDYNCGYCRASLPAIRQLLASDPGLRIVFREWPILSAESGAAARLSLAAAAQGKFRDFHTRLYAQGSITPDGMARAAQQAGVDPHRAAPGAEEELARNMAVARDLGLTGTPSWIIGDRAVSAALPLAELKKAIAEARAGK